MKQGTSIAAVRQELGSMNGPSQNKREVRVRSFREVAGSTVRDSLLILFGAVALVLLVACVNVANLLLARTASREREIAVRAALGAGRFRLIRQFLTESLLLSFAGASAGAALGMWGSRALVRAAAGQLPRAADIGMDWRVFAFLLAACVIAGISFGLAPALAAARGGSSALKSRAAASVRDGLVVAEIALAFVLLAGAGLLMRTFLNLQRAETGFRSENVLTIHMVLANGAESTAIQERVAQVPGVRFAGFISMLPLQSSGWGAGFHVPGREEILPVELRYVTPDYFKAMGIPLRSGREFSPRDTADQRRVIIINEALARQYFPNQDPVGVQIDRGLIVGVVGDVRPAKLSEPATPVIFYTMAQNFAQIRSNGSTLVVSGHIPVENLVSPLRAAIREVSPNQALFRVATMRRVIETSLAQQRLYTWLLGLFAAIGTLLAVAGIYGVIAYLVTLRTREFGIRMAIGADAARVVRLVMRRGAVTVALGLAIGILGAVLLTRALRTLLYGVTPTDPATFAAMAALLAAVALSACLIPARRAAKVDPAVALRVE
jgi:predicted permease